MAYPKTPFCPHCKNLNKNRRLSLLLGSQLLEGPAATWLCVACSHQFNIEWEGSVGDRISTNDHNQQGEEI